MLTKKTFLLLPCWQHLCGTIVLLFYWGWEDDGMGGKVWCGGWSGAIEWSGHPQLGCPPHCPSANYPSGSWALHSIYTRVYSAFLEKKKRTGHVGIVRGRNARWENLPADRHVLMKDTWKTDVSTMACNTWLFPLFRGCTSILLDVLVFGFLLLMLLIKLL